MTDRWHVLPIKDLREHEETDKCWCNPIKDDDYQIFIHNALDGREKFETG